MIYQQRNLNCSMMFLLLARAFTDASPDTAFPWLNTNATVWGGIPELKRVFFSSVLQIIFNLFRAYHHCRHHREKKKDHSTAFFQASKWFREFKKSGFSKPSWLWEQHTNLARPGVALAVTMWSVRNISGGQGSANPLPFAEGSEKAPVGPYFGSQYVELVFSRMELQPQAQIAAR